MTDKTHTIELPVPLAMQAEETAVLIPSERMDCAEWFETKYYLSDKVSPRMPGLFSFSYYQWLRPIVELVSKPPVEINIEGCTQWGKTTFEVGVFGYIKDQDPAPTIFVMPQKKDTGTRVNVNIRQMFEHCPDLLSGVKRQEVRNILIGKETVFDKMISFLGWATSLMTLSDVSVCNVLGDELKNWKLTDFKTNPIDDLRTRQRIFWDCYRTIYTTSPQDKGDLPDTHFRMGSDERLWAGCPYCGKWHEIRQSKETVFIEKDEHGEFYHPDEYLNGTADCWYQCPHCQKRWSEMDRAAANAKGVWVAKTQTMSADGKLSGDRPDGNHYSFRINSMMLHPRFWNIRKEVREFVHAVRMMKSGDITALKDYTRNQQARPWEQRIKTIKANALADKVVLCPRKKVPSWCLILVAGCDYHLDENENQRIDYEVRGFGRNLLNQVILAGSVSNFRQLEAVLFYPFDWQDSEKQETKLAVCCVFIDSGYKPTIVYDWCRKWKSWAWPIKGVENQRHPIVRSDLEKIKKDVKYRGMSLLLLDKQYFSDYVMNWIESESMDEGTTLYYHEIDQDTRGNYFAEVAGVAQVKNDKGILVWQAKDGVESKLHHHATARYASAAAIFKEANTWMDLDTDQMPEELRRKRQRAAGQRRKVWMGQSLNI